MGVYFANSRIKSAINNKLSQFELIELGDEFEVKLFRHTKSILETINLSPTIWDEKCTITTELYIQEFTTTLKEDTNRENLELLFFYCLNFLMEVNIKTQEPLLHQLDLIIDFSIDELNSFNPKAKAKIKNSISKLPILITKESLSNPNLEIYKSAPNFLTQAKAAIDEWDSNFQKRETTINNQINKLEEHKTAFNFVGLYNGFNNLSIEKKNELNWSKGFLFILGTLATLPITIEALYLIFYAPESTLDKIAIRTIPIISITFILIYYFKVALSSFNSTRAQITQIELRKSLCAFIQNYSEYAKEIKTNNTDILKKFEEIIFSNIMTTDEKIPSTFDGLEQIASLISAVKPK
ncbi:hypothetical protein [Enterobacter kobei]|uniref:hypothetical protein n=1 Tax=Enterobacter kobei TaxID=208224 RepID=UPI0022E16046|nr:hypothetical protein [Enterobacter kobei]